MFDKRHWRGIAAQLLEQTRARRITWVEDALGPERTTGFTCTFEADGTSLSLWGYPTGYSYELSVRRKNLDDSEFTDHLRVTNKTAADGAPLAELFRCVRDAVAAEREREARENSEITFRQLLDSTLGIPVGDDYLSVRGFSSDDYNGHFEFDATQWNTIIDAMLDRTVAGTLQWQPIGPVSPLQGQYTATLPGEITLGFVIDEDDSEGLDGRCFSLYLLDGLDVRGCRSLHDVQAIEALDSKELDAGNAEPRSHAALEALHDVLRRELVAEHTAFQEIATEETFRSVLAAITAGAS